MVNGAAEGLLLANGVETSRWIGCTQVGRVVFRPRDLSFGFCDPRSSLTGNARTQTACV